MTTHNSIMALFYAVDQEILEVSKHPGAKLYSSGMVTLALLCAIKGGGMRAFYRWLRRDYLLITTAVLLDAVSGPGPQLLNGPAFSGHADDRHLQAPAFHHGKVGKIFLSARAPVAPKSTSTSDCFCSLCFPYTFVDASRTTTPALQGSAPF